MLLWTRLLPLSFPLWCFSAWRIQEEELVWSFLRELLLMVTGLLIRSTLDPAREAGPGKLCSVLDDADRFIYNATDI